MTEILDAVIIVLQAIGLVVIVLLLVGFMLWPAWDIIWQRLWRRK